MNIRLEEFIEVNKRTTTDINSISHYNDSYYPDSYHSDSYHNDSYYDDTHYSDSYGER